VAEFAQAARDAVASGIAVNQAAAFAAELRRAGEVLSASGSGDTTATAVALEAVTAAIRNAYPTPLPPPAPARVPERETAQETCSSKRRCAGTESGGRRRYSRAVDGL
jgi:hypothetical protein